MFCVSIRVINGDLFLDDIFLFLHVRSSRCTLPNQSKNGGWVDGEALPSRNFLLSKVIGGGENNIEARKEGEHSVSQSEAGHLGVEANQCPASERRVLSAVFRLQFFSLVSSRVAHSGSCSHVLVVEVEGSIIYHACLVCLDRAHATSDLRD